MSTPEQDALDKVRERAIEDMVAAITPIAHEAMGKIREEVEALEEVWSNAEIEEQEAHATMFQMTIAEMVAAVVSVSYESGDKDVMAAAYQLVLSTFRAIGKQCDAITGDQHLVGFRVRKQNKAGLVLPPGAHS